MLNYLKRLQDERDSLTQTATTITETAAAEERDVTETERASISAMAERCASIDGQLVTFAAQAESQRAYATLRGQLAQHEDEAEAAPVQRRSAPPARPESWGEMFVNSPQFRGFEGHGSSGRLDVPGVFATRDPITIADWGNTLQPSRYIPPHPAITTPLLDAVSHTTTANNMIEWFTVGGAYPLAGVVAEGALKPEADIPYTLHSDALKTYAHYKPISRQALEDIPQIQSIVEGQLQGGIYSKLEVDTGAALAAAALTEIDSSGGMLAALRRAIGQVQAVGFPNAHDLVLNPADWADLDLDVMAATSNGPQGGAPFWGLHPISTVGVPVGTAYVGDLKAAVNIFDRGSATVYMTDSHSDYFVRNLLIILAETRALPTVQQGAAVVRVTDTSVAEPPAAA
jgi:Phage capsid family